MTQYIDKSAVVAEIERAQKILNIDDCGGRSVMAWSEGFKNFLNTLEVKEVDLDKEIIDFINNHYTICFDNNTLQNNEFDFLTIKDVEEIAKHFFELVLKAQKGE